MFESYMPGWDCIPDALLVCDCKGQIVYWNQACTRIFGWSAQEALGQNLDLIIPEKHRTKHWMGWDQAMESGHSHYGSSLLSVPALHQSGQRLSIAFSISLIKEEGKVQGILALVRDESARFEEIKKLKAQIAALP